MGYQKPDGEWYVPYGFGPRYCLGKNLAQLEMKIFLAALARSVDFPKLAMLPENYDYDSNGSNSPSSPENENNDGDYFSVEWCKTGAVISVAADGVLATVSPAEAPALDDSAAVMAILDAAAATVEDNGNINVDEDNYPVPIVPITNNIGALNVNATLEASLQA